MGLHREIRRLAQLGARGYWDHATRRSKERLRIFLDRNAPQRRRCSCCGWAGWSFVDYEGKGYVVRRIVCPVCGSHGRHRALAPFLRTLLAELSPGKKVLHLAPERALERTFMERRDLLYVTADLIRRRWLGKLGALTDLTSLAFRDNSFSLVLCSHVLEHVRDDHAALAEIARVVAFGATVLILVPTWKPWNSRRTLEFGMPHPRFDDHWRIYGSDLPARIEACGMRCAAVDLRAPLQRRAFERFALTDEVLFICVKPKIEGRKAAVASRPHTARIPCNLALLERPFRTSAQPCDRQAAGLEGGQGWAR